MTGFALRALLPAVLMAAAVSWFAAHSARAGGTFVVNYGDDAVHQGDQILRHIAGLPPNQTQPCPAIGVPVLTS